jgi:hypothetical protein
MNDPLIYAVFKIVCFPQPINTSKYIYKIILDSISIQSINNKLGTNLPVNNYIKNLIALYMFAYTDLTNTSSQDRIVQLMNDNYLMSKIVNDLSNLSESEEGYEYDEEDCDYEENVNDNNTSIYVANFIFISLLLILLSGLILQNIKKQRKV